MGIDRASLPIVLRTDTGPVGITQYADLLRNASEPGNLMLTIAQQDEARRLLDELDSRLVNACLDHLKGRLNDKHLGDLVHSQFFEFEQKARAFLARVARASGVDYGTVRPADGSPAYEAFLARPVMP
jgi:hypothetical protein